MYRIKSAILVSLCLLSISGYSQTYYVSTLAGDTANISIGPDFNAGYRDGAATSALFNSPTGIAIDTAGKFVYVADSYNNIIRKINTATGLVSTLAGDIADIPKGLDSNIGYLNANNPLSAKFNNPLGICIDDTGNVYIADTYNNVIRKIWASGKVTTYAGRDSAGTTFAGYINGPDSAAEFFYPTSVTIDASGNLYVADNGNNAIREISTTGIVSTLAGKGPDSAGYVNGPINTAQFYSLYGIALGKTGAIYVSQFASNATAVRRLFNDTVTTYAGFDTLGFDSNVVAYTTIPVGYKNGKETFNTDSATVLFNSPAGLSFDTAGNLLIADEYNNVIRKFKASDSVVSTLAGKDSAHATFEGYVNGPDSVAEFFNPMGIAADKKGNFYVSDLGNNVIRRISTNPLLGVSPVKQAEYVLTAYPNPCSDRLNIVSSFNGRADLLDVTGRIIWTNIDFKSPYTLSTSNINPGVYFLRITSSTATEIKKVEILK